MPNKSRLPFRPLTERYGPNDPVPIDTVWTTIEDPQDGVMYHVPFLAYLRAVTGYAPFSGPFIAEGFVEKKSP